MRRRPAVAGDEGPGDAPLAPTDYRVTVACMVLTPFTDGPGKARTG